GGERNGARWLNARTGGRRCRNNAGCWRRRVLRSTGSRPRSLPTGCAFPASQASSESGEMARLRPAEFRARHARGLVYPELVLQTAKAMRRVDPGGTLTVLTTDPVASIDFPYYCWARTLVDDERGGSFDLQNPHAENPDATGVESP